MIGGTPVIMQAPTTCTSTVQMGAPTTFTSPVQMGAPTQFASPVQMGAPTTFASHVQTGAPSTFTSPAQTGASQYTYGGPVNTVYGGNTIPHSFAGVTTCAGTGGRGVIIPSANYSSTTNYNSAVNHCPAGNYISSASYATGSAYTGNLINAPLSQTYSQSPSTFISKPVGVGQQISYSQSPAHMMGNPVGTLAPRILRASSFSAPVQSTYTQPLRASSVEVIPASTYLQPTVQSSPTQTYTTPFIQNYATSTNFGQPTTPLLPYQSTGVPATMCTSPAPFSSAPMDVVAGPAPEAMDIPVARSLAHVFHHVSGCCALESDWDCVSGSFCGRPFWLQLRRAPCPRLI